MVKIEEDKTEWLPVVEFESIEYVVDVQNRRFGRLADPVESVVFHSGEGGEMVKTMSGTEWRAWISRADDREGVV